MKSYRSFPAISLSRRQILGSFLAVSAIQFAPVAFANTTAVNANFMALSRYLTERDDLSSILGSRLQIALQSLNGGFIEQVDALLLWINNNKITLDDLNNRLSAEKPDLQMLPRAIMQAWYMGIAGSGENTRVVAYEYALNAQLVSAYLKPPTYSYGLYGSWTADPDKVKLKLAPVQN